MPFNLQKELYESVKEVTWNFKGILDTKGRLHEIPKNLNFQALFEVLVFERLLSSFKKYGIDVSVNENIRSYPDMILKGGVLGKQVIALDVKTGRREKGRTGFTLGSYAGYFRKPDQKLCFDGIYSYNDFSSHLAICFVYDWNPDKDTLNMISNIEIIVNEKWCLASKTTGTGTTTAIGSIRDIKQLKSGKGEFRSENDFLDYWRAKRLRS